MGANMQGRKKIIVISFIITVVLLTLIIQGGIILYPMVNQEKEADVIIVLGCQVEGDTPSTFLQNRINKALELYNKEFAPMIIASGGQGPRENKTEASVIASELIKAGVPRESILLEEKSHSTRENLKYSRVIMEEKGLNTAVLVSNKYHLFRAAMLARALDIKSYTSGIFVKNRPFKEIYGYIREVPAVIKDFILINLKKI